MGNEIVAPSEAALYAMMVLNVVGVLGLLLWAWRRGHLRDLEQAAAVALADGDDDHDADEINQRPADAPDRAPRAGRHDQSEASP